MRNTKTRSALRVFAVFFLTLAITACYSVTPFVSQAYAAAPKAKSITLKTTAKTVDINGKVTVSVKSVKPAKASKAVTWKSSNKKIAKVSSKGVVTGKRKGKVIITATSKSNKKVKKTITITVKNIKPSKVTLNKTKATLNKGKTLTLKATVAPKGVYAPVKWKSSNTKVAKVSKAGKVTAVGAGTATITVYTDKSKAGKTVKATCKVTVKDSSVKPEPVTPDDPEPDNVVEKPATLGEMKSRTMTISIDMTDETRYPKGHVVEVWVPVPQTDEYQIIENYNLSADKAAVKDFYTEENSGWKNKMAYFKWDENTEPADRTATVSFDADRFAVSRPDPKEDSEATIPADAQKYITLESKYVKVKDPIVQKYAKIAAGDAKSTLGKAENIYNWVIANLERLDVGDDLGDAGIFKNATGCGNGDVVKILTEIDTVGRSGGHCTDINSTFVALCRANGIAAREMFGIRLNDKSNDGQHCWAEFYLPGEGWTYADPADVLKQARTVAGDDRSLDAINAARKDQSVLDKKAALWCGVDNNRIVLSRGRDVKLNPEQGGDLRNTFGYPYAEVDGVQKDASPERKEIDCTKYGEFKYTITCGEIAKGDAVLVDARTPDVYAGWAVDGNEKGGHLKDALSFSAQWLNVAYPEDKSGYKTRDEGLALALADSGLTDRNADITVYDTNDKDAAVVAEFLKSKAFRNVTTANKAAEIATADLESYPNYQLYVPAEVVKNISDNVTKGEALSENAKSIVGDRNIRIFHAEYASSGKYTDDGYMEDNDIDWTDGTVYYGTGHVPGAEPISTDDFEPERYRPRDIIDNAGEGITWIADYLLRSDEQLLDLAAKYGLQKDDFVVVVGPQPMATTKIALVMKYLGIDNVYVMSGAYNEWNLNGYDLEKEVWNKPATQTTDITAIGNPDLIDSQDEAADMIGKSGYQLVDTRRVEEWEGKTSGYSYHDIAGRIAGDNVVNSPSGVGHSSSMYYYRNPDSTMKSPEALKAMWAKQGVDPAKHLSFFCGSGWRAAEETWDAWVMGLDASMYNDGWQGWSNEGRPFIDQNGVSLALDANKGILVESTEKIDNTPDFLNMDKEKVWPHYGIKIEGLKDTDFVIDVRKASLFAESHYKGSVSAPVITEDGAEPDAETLAKNLEAAFAKAGEKRVVIVCNTGNSLARRAMNYFQKAGKDMSNITYLIGGAAALKEAGLLVEDDTPSAPDFAGMTTAEWAEYGTESLAEEDYILDVRAVTDYNKAHIPGAVNVPTDGNPIAADSETASNLSAELGKANGKRLVIICYSGNKYAKAAMTYFYGADPTLDKTKVTYLIGGDNGYPADQKVPAFSQLSGDDWAAYGVDAIADNDYVVDVRPADVYKAGHIEGAVNVATDGNVIAEGSDAATGLKNAFADSGKQRIVLICYTGNKFAKAAMDYLYNRYGNVGTDRVTYLKGGFNGWKTANPYVIGASESTVVDPANKTVSVGAWVASDEINMNAYADQTHHVLVNKNGKNAPVALLNTEAVPRDVYTALEAIGASAGADGSGVTPGLNSEVHDGGAFVQGHKINVNFVWDGGTAGMSDFFNHVKEPGLDNSEENIEPYVADMRFGGCSDVLDDSKPEGNPTGCITCTFSCWIGTVSNAQYAYQSGEALVNRANVPKKDTPVTVVYSLGE